MYDPPAYVWALTIAGPAAIAAATCIALYAGAVRAGLGRRRAAMLGRAATGQPDPGRGAQVGAYGPVTGAFCTVRQLAQLVIWVP
jgi:hypothetical protein